MCQLDSADGLLAGREFGMLVCYVRDGDRVFETYWTTGRGNEVMGNSLLMLDLTVYGRQEPWEDSPEGWTSRSGVASRCRSNSVSTTGVWAERIALKVQPGHDLQITGSGNLIQTLQATSLAEGELVPELVRELIISFDGFARGQRSPAYFGYLVPGFENWINTNTSCRSRRSS